jgi:hypothetical protein
MYTLSQTPNTPTIVAIASNVRKANFLKQQAYSDRLIKEIKRTTMIALMIAFADATNELEKQAVIEAAQEVGHLELSIDFMSQLG